MKIQERYSVARNTNNLKSAERTTFSASDVIAAAGMTAQQHETAMLLWEVTFRGKTSAKMALIELLAGQLTPYMLKSRLKGDPRSIARETLAWWLHGTCQPCGGRGYQLILGTPMLSDKHCKHCEGSGKVALPRGEAYTWLFDRLSKLTAMAGGEVMKKLAHDMDL
jgi:hypothetical protein